MRAADLFLAPFTLLACVFFRTVRLKGVVWFPVSRWIFRKAGLFPVADHYYEPVFTPDRKTHTLLEERALPGIDLNVLGQLRLLEKFDYNQELMEFPLRKRDDLSFYYGNDYFGSGDAEFLYNMIRLYKPGKLIEVGSGFSSLLAQAALRKNTELDSGYACDHVCIEPYENPWLGRAGLRVIRQPVQEVGDGLFAGLSHNDILFIDSSHVVRSGGDVIFEVLRVLPQLRAGVIVHFHDIFTPRDYPRRWLVDEIRLWNEQYLLEAFLSQNDRFQVIAALNYLAHHHRDELAAKCPVYAEEASNREPGSFWIQKTERP